MRQLCVAEFVGHGKGEWGFLDLQIVKRAVYPFCEIRGDVDLLFSHEQHEFPNADGGKEQLIIEDENDPSVRAGESPSAWVSWLIWWLLVVLGEEWLELGRP